jgi:hypothetical protein
MSLPLISARISWFNEFARPFADAVLDPIERVVEKMHRRLGPGCKAANFVVMSWSPGRRFNAGDSRSNDPGDNAKTDRAR